MSVTSYDFIESAKLSFQSKTEIGFRNCISRSYYGMYHSALELIENPIPNYATGGSHHCLINYLADKHNAEKHNKRELLKISYILRQNRDLRCDADYELESDTITFATAEDSITMSEKIVGICLQLAKAA